MGNARVGNVGFKSVFKVLEGSGFFIIFFAVRQLTVKQLSRDVEVVQPDDTSCSVHRHEAQPDTDSPQFFSCLSKPSGAVCTAASYDC